MVNYLYVSTLLEVYPGTRKIPYSIIDICRVIAKGKVCLYLYSICTVQGRKSKRTKWCCSNKKYTDVVHFVIMNQCYICWKLYVLGTKRVRNTFTITLNYVKKQEFLTRICLWCCPSDKSFNYILYVFAFITVYYFVLLWIWWAILEFAPMRKERFSSVENEICNRDLIGYAFINLNFMSIIYRSNRELVWIYGITCVN